MHSYLFTYNKYSFPSSRSQRKQQPFSQGFSVFSLARSLSGPRRWTSSFLRCASNTSPLRKDTLAANKLKVVNFDEQHHPQCPLKMKSTTTSPSFRPFSLLLLRDIHRRPPLNQQSYSNRFPRQTKHFLPRPWSRRSVGIHLE